MNNLLQNPKTLNGAVILNLSLWFLIILPNILLKGPSNFLVSLRSSSYCFLTCLLLFFSIAFQFLYSMYKLQTYLLGPILQPEWQLMLSTLLKDNPIMQLAVILIQEPLRNSVESLIWSSIFIVFAWAKASCIVIISRLNDNKLKNLEKFNFIVFFQTFFLVLSNFVLFQKAGFWILLLNFEAIFVFKDNFLAHYQISKTSTISGSTELKMEIFENFFKIVQWVLVGFMNGSIFTTNPIQFLLIIKLQGYFTGFLKKVRQFSKYRSAIYQFTLKYPPLKQSEMERVLDEKCCVCWDLLVTGSSCKITCGHILHIECIWRWMLRDTERKCPMCKQTFLEPEGPENFSFFSWLTFSGRNQRANEEDLRRLIELFPNLSENEILQEIERAGSVQQVIDNLLGE